MEKTRIKCHPSQVLVHLQPSVLDPLSALDTFQRLSVDRVPLTGRTGPLPSHNPLICRALRDLALYRDHYQVSTVQHVAPCKLKREQNKVRRLIPLEGGLTERLTGPAGTLSHLQRRTAI